MVLVLGRGSGLVAAAAPCRPHASNVPVSLLLVLRCACRHRGLVYKNPFDLGYKRNWQAVFGARPWWHFLLPVRYAGAPGDGRRFEVNR